MKTNANTARASIVQTDTVNTPLYISSRVGVANTDEQEIELIETLKPDIVITDLMRNHEYTGLDIIKEYFKKEEKPEFLVISADKKEDVINNGLEVAGYLKKPFNLTLIADEIIRIKKEIIDFKSKEE